MQEQQGSLMPQLSGLPGPRPFKRGKTKMEDNKTTSSNPTHADGKPDMSKPVTASVDEIVAKTADAIGAGKSFGGWTDKVEEGATISKLTIPVKLGKGQPAYKEKVSRDDAKAAADMFDSLRSKKKPVKENNISKTMARVKALAMKQAKKAAEDAPLVKIGPDSSRPTHKQQYTKNIRPSDLKKKNEEVEQLDEVLNIMGWAKKIKSAANKNFRKSVPPSFGEEVEQLDEVLPLIPAALGAAKALGGAALKKGAMGMAKNMAGSALGKVFKKSKEPGEEATT